MNGLEKPFRKKSDLKNRKNSKNQSEIAACEQKTTSEKANFCSNTVFSLYFKFGAKKFHAAKLLAFSLHFLFRRDQNHYSNLTSNIMKMCEQILKKRQRPNTIQILWIVKNQEKANNSPSNRCAAIKNHETNNSLDVSGRPLITQLTWYRVDNRCFVAIFLVQFGKQLFVEVLVKLKQSTIARYSKLTFCMNHSYVKITIHVTSYW